MRVLLLSSTYHPIVGGAESYAKVLSEGLVSRGTDVTVFTDGVPDQPARQLINGVDVVRASNYSTNLARRDNVHWEQMQFSLLDELSHVLEVGGYDLIHANSGECSILGSVASLQFGIPLCATFHEQSPELGPLGRGRQSLIYGRLPIGAYFAGSRFYERKAILAGAQKERVRLVYHGVDLAKFSAGNLQRGRTLMGNPKDATVFVCLARLSPRKGILDLIRAVDIVRKSVPNILCVIAGSVNSGDIAYRNSLYEEINVLELGGNVAIIENCTHDDVPDLLAAASFSILPSRAEGLGLSILESMAAERAVIGTRISGITEIVSDGENGILVEPGDLAAMADAIAVLANDSTLRRGFSRAGYALVHESFDSSRMLSETEKVYADLVKGGVAS